MSYQAVIRDAGNKLITNHTVGIRISIMQGTEIGLEVYKETFNPNPQTNANGLISIEIGSGLPIKGTFATIDWAKGPYYIKTEVDPTGGASYSITGSSQLLSVPYALFAKSTENEFSGNYNDLTNKPTIDGSETKVNAGTNISVTGKGTTASPYVINSNAGSTQGNNAGDMLYWNGTQWIVIPLGSNGQVLTVNNGIPKWIQPSVQLPTLITKTISGITNTSAISGGCLSDGGSVVIAKGICWNTSTNPTTANNKTEDGSGSECFNSTLTNLNPNTTYFIRAYATTNVGTGYGNELSFTTNQSISIPSISTTALTDITSVSVVGGGNVTSNGGATITARGLCWNTTGTPTISDNKNTEGSGTGSFASSITGLTQNTTYYVRAYATNSKGTTYGEQVSFTTNSILVTITTSAATSITFNAATSGGNINYDGGNAITVRGICYNTTGNPTIADKTTSNGNGSGSFASSLTGLTSNTTYFIRAYGLNNSGVLYGDQLSFKTSIGPVVGTTTDSRDGHVYKTVTIGNQTWMAENLAYLPSVNNKSQSSSSAAMYYVYSYDGTNVSDAKTNSSYKYSGVLYNWIAAMNSCPTGWHLPSDIEWTILENYLIANGYNYDGSMDEDGDRNTLNKIAKSLANTSGWKTSSVSFVSGSIGLDIFSNNSSYFSAIASESYAGTFTNAGYGYWWSSTEYDLNNAFYRGLTYNSVGLGRDAIYKSRGHSVRCIKD